RYWGIFVEIKVNLTDNISNILLGVYGMRKYLFLLIAALTLVACGNANADSENVNDSNDNENINDTEDNKNEIETLSSEEVSITLAEDDNIIIELELVNHGRDNDNDFISLHTSMTNKEKRTYEMYLNELVVDGELINKSNVWLDEEGIDPEETKDVIINGYDDKELTVDEHIAGTIIYTD